MNEAPQPITVREQIERILIETFQPETLTVIDESHLHAGHRHAPAGGQSHFRIEISATPFAGNSRVERERMVTNSLSHLMTQQIHAIVVKFVH